MQGLATLCAPNVILKLRQVLHSGVLLLPHFKTQSRVFFNQGSMMQGALKSYNILFLNLNFGLSF